MVRIPGGAAGMAGKQQVPRLHESPRNACRFVSLGMTVNLFSIVLGAALVMTLGCARRGAHPFFPDMKIPVGCVSEIRMVECDARVQPPKCRSARVTYRSGCEEIVAGRR